MPFRIFKHDGAVTDRVDGYPEDQRQYLSPDEAAALEVADALGVDVSTVIVDHVEADPEPAVTIPPTPPPPPTPFDTFTAAEVAALPASPIGVLSTVQTILGKADADITQAELKTLVLIMARFLLRKFLSGWR